MTKMVLRKNCRNWWIVWITYSIIGTWIIFAVTQTALEKNDKLLRFWIVVSYPFLASLWIIMYEIPVFAGLKLVNDYLVINKSLIIPLHQYIRIDAIERVSRSKSHLESTNPRHPTTFLPMEVTQFIFTTNTGKCYRTNRLPVDFDSFDKKQFFHHFWSERSMRRIALSKSKEKPAYTRIALLPLIVRCMILFLSLFVYYPWYAYSWFPW